jgi:hypothetical protein
MFERGDEDNLAEMGSFFYEPKGFWSLYRKDLPLSQQRKLKKTSGVYVLYRPRKEKKRGPQTEGRPIYYVGKTATLQKRLDTHLKDHLRRKWKYFAAYGTGSREAEVLESLLIRICQPPGNLQKKHIPAHKAFPTAVNLRDVIQTYYKRRSRQYYSVNEP